MHLGYPIYRSLGGVMLLRGLKSLDRVLGLVAPIRIPSSCIAHFAAPVF